MKRDPEEVLLDVCLDELLGGQQPPDLSERILKALELRRESRAAPATLESPPPAEHPRSRRHPPLPPRADQRGSGKLTPPPVEIPPPRLAAGRSRRTWRRDRRIDLAMAAAVAVAATLLALAWSALPPLQQTSPDAAPRNGVVDNPRGPNGRDAGVPESRRIALQPRRDADGGERPAPDAPPGGGARDPSATPLVSRGPFGSPGTGAPGSGVPPAERPDDDVVAALSDAEVVAHLDSLFRDIWRAAGVRPAAEADDEEWCRRTFQTLLGRPASPAELAAFVADASPDKRGRLVDRLQGGQAYVEEYASHWGRFWTEVLLGSGSPPGGAPGSPATLEQFLRDSLTRNVSWSEVAGELIAATGASDPAAADYNGATHFLLLSQDRQGVRAADRICRALLGQRRQCAQCHDHPEHSWSQRDFWQLSAFFPARGAVREGDGWKLTALPARDIGEVYFERPDGTLEAAAPRLPDGSALADAASSPSPRAQLADWVRHSTQFEQATVNRMWDYFLGAGFTQPVDDLGPHHPPSHPQVLAHLAEQFAAHGHDLHALVRWITLSTPFARASTSGDTPWQWSAAKGQVPLFSRFTHPPGSSASVVDVMVLAARSTDPVGRELARRDWLSQSVADPSSTDPSTLPPGSLRIVEASGATTSATSGLLDRRPQPGAASLLDRILNSPLETPAKVQHLFHAAIGRDPTRRELQAFEQIQQARAGDSTAALHDLWWSLRQSGEFLNQR